MRYLLQTLWCMKRMFSNLIFKWIMAHVLPNLPLIHPHFLLCLSRNPASKSRHRPMHMCAHTHTHTHTQHTHTHNDVCVNNKVLMLEVLPTGCHPSNTLADRHTALVRPVHSFPHFFFFFFLSLAVFKICKWFGLSCHNLWWLYTRQLQPGLTHTHTHTHIP